MSINQSLFVHRYYVEEMPVKDIADSFECCTENLRKFRTSYSLPDRRREWTDEDTQMALEKAAKCWSGADFDGDMRSLAYVMRHRKTVVRKYVGEIWLQRFAPQAIDRSSEKFMSKTKITMKFKRHSPDVPVPAYATAGSAGIDLTAAEDCIIKKGEVKIISAGLSVAVPPGFVGQVCSRSGLAAKQGVFVLNAPGILDSDYCGEQDIVKVILFNTGATTASYKVTKGDRIAQLVVMPYAMFDLEEVETMDAPDRGGIGSTGK